MTDTDDAYQFEFASIDGERLPLDAWRGQPVLVVNTASCHRFDHQLNFD